MERIVHDLIPDSPEWHAFRFEHDGASEIAAVLGLSTTMTRSELLRIKATGTPREFSDFVQKRVLDSGKEAEALARPIAAEIIGSTLYPVTCSIGRTSASCDGLDMMDEIAWEHKKINQTNAPIVRSGLVPDEHMPQCQQVLMVTGAEKLLFMVSDGTRENMAYVWVEPDTTWFDRIRAGWIQFNKDRATYVPTEIVAEAVGRTPETLPALHIVMKGEISASNMDEFKQVALAAIRSVNRDLKTDQDFADSAKARKWCEDIESRVAAAKDHALGQTKTIDDLFRTMDEISAEARDVRLALEKLEKARKESRRGEIVAEGIKALADHVTALNTRLGKPYMPATSCDFGGTIKGLRTFDSMQNAVDTALANAKISASAIADKIQSNLTTLRELGSEHKFLFADVAQLVLKEPEFVAMAVKNRISEHQAAEAQKEADQRERIANEERIKAEAAAQARADASIAAAAAVALADKQAQDAIAAAQATPVPAPVIAQPVPATVTVRQVVQPMFTSTPVLSEKPVADASARAFVDRISPPTMSLGAISSRLGFAVTSQLLSTLGFEATTVKAAKMFHSEDFPAICRALIEHIESVSELEAA